MKKFLMIALLTTMFVGCVQDSVEDVAIVANNDKIFATIAAPDDEGRVQLDENQRTTWTAKDKIVVQTNAELAVYQFDGQTGDRGGSFTKLIDGGTLPDDYKFNGKYYAFYPYEAWTSIGCYVSDGTPVVFSTISATQPYLKDSYGLHANLMMGASGDGRNYEFKNLLGYLCLSLTGDKKVKSIKLQGRNNENIAGTYYFNVTDINDFGLYSDASTSITLDCKDGVQLSSTPTKFYFTLPPMTFYNGFSMVVTFTDEEVLVQETSREVVIKRNTILPMKVINTAVDASDYQWLYIYHTGATVAVPYLDVSGYVDWGDGNKELFSSILAPHHDYRDGKESHTVTVKVMGASQFTIYNCKGISKIDLSNF